MKKANIGVVGIGAVGVEIIRVIKERKFPFSQLRVFARSPRDTQIDGVTYKVEAIEGADFSGLDIALFAGTEGESGASVLYAQKFVEKGAIVIDNGSDFRLNNEVPLVVPEVNRDQIKKNKGIIANPNCTTIQAIVALGGIYRNFGLEKIVLTSFQAVSGAGKKAGISLWEEAKEIVKKNQDNDFDHLNIRIEGKPACFSEQIAFNVIPQIGSFSEEGYTSEEWKVVNETHKILNNKSIKITATCVRVPVFNAHSEAIYFKLQKKAEVKDLEAVLQKSEGVSYIPDAISFPIYVSGKDNVFVGRLRRDPFEENSFWLWCVGDNLRKGAALNAVQIAEYLV